MEPAPARVRLGAGPVRRSGWGPKQGISAWTLGLRGKGVGGLPTRVSVNSDGKWVMLGAPGKNWAEGVYGEGAGTASVVSVRREIYLGYLEE